MSKSQKYIIFIGAALIVLLVVIYYFTNKQKQPEAPEGDTDKAGGTTAPDPAPTPIDNTNYVALINALYDAIHSWLGTDEDTINAILLPLSAAKLKKISQKYYFVKKENLLAALKDEADDAVFADDSLDAVINKLDNALNP